MAAQEWNPLSYFREMGTLSKVLLLLGFVFLTAALAHGASFSDRMVPGSLVFVSLSLTVHYFSQSRPRLLEQPYSRFTDWEKMSAGAGMSVITIGLVIWFLLIPSPKTVNVATRNDIPKAADVPKTSDAKEDSFPAAPVSKKSTDKGSKTSGTNNTSGGNSTQATGDKGTAVGPVTQGPCSILQAGGSNNQASGGNCGPRPLKMSEEQEGEVAKLLSSFSGEAVEIDVDRATPETDQFAEALRSSLLLAGITSTRVNAIFSGGCIAYPGVSFMAGVNRQVLVRAVWSALVEKKVVDRADSIPGCSRSGEPNELHIYIRPNS
jgi:hypothetical protein